VYHLDIAGKNLYYIQEDDLALFTNLTSINAAENNLPFAKFGVLPKLAKLEFSCNGVADLDLEIEGRFENLEFLDLSYNYVRDSALIVLAHLRLKTLDLSSNNLCKFPKTVLNMNHWQDDLIEHLMPIQVAALDAMKAPKNDEKPKPRIVQSARDFGKTYMDKLSQRPFTTSKNKEYKNKDYINFKVCDATNIGFSVLSHLILDKNNFGADIDGLFFILGKLQQYLLLR
jgi:Leucine-rich repeat (LRR) protein